MQGDQGGDQGEEGSELTWGEAVGSQTTHSGEGDPAACMDNLKTIPLEHKKF